jgi:hypothetical protein
MSDVVVRAGDRWLFRCPGCECAHGVNVAWTFNGNRVLPTIRPSILTNHISGSVGPRCHSFVTDGRIEFLSDSTHALAGQTVELPPWEVLK